MLKQLTLEQLGNMSYKDIINNKEDDIYDMLHDDESDGTNNYQV